MLEPHLAGQAHWRAMQAADLPQVALIAAQVHPAYPEHPAVFAERLQLYPNGCWVWQQAEALAGYLFSHPWHAMQPPALDSLLQVLPSCASTYYLHDIALLPLARGQQATPRILPLLAQRARELGLDNISLVAVNQSLAFWQGLGFSPLPAEPGLSAKLASYGPGTHYLQCALSEMTTD